MATLNLFPARIPFVDDQGRLTPEAYRALQAVASRIGGAIGDQGVDVFADVMGAFVSDNAALSFDSINPPMSVDYLAPQDMQPVEFGYQADMLMQGES